MSANFRRRDFLALASASAAAWPLAAWAQQAVPLAPGMKRLGYIDIFPEDDPQATIHRDAFWQGVGKYGWTPRNLNVDFRWGANTPDKSKQPVQELIDAKPDVIFAIATNNLNELASRTKTIPVVFSFVTGTTASTLVTSFGKPGGNLTGFVISPDDQVTGKVVELLKEVAPTIVRIGLVYSPDGASSQAGGTDAFVGRYAAATAKLGLKFVPLPVATTADVEPAIRAFDSEPLGGLVMSGDSWMVTNRAEPIAVVARYKLPAIWGQILFATDGGMIAYAVNAATIVRAAAEYAGLILNGSKPADLPVQLAPISMTLNLKTAKALGITIPQSVLIQADEMIE